jgi:hypothetical protein
MYCVEIRIVEIITNNGSENKCKYVFVDFWGEQSGIFFNASAAQGTVPSQVDNTNHLEIGRL